MSRNRRLWIGIAILAFVAYSVWWWLAARTLQSRVDDWVANERLGGVDIAPAGFRIGGYPLGFAIESEDVALRWPSGFGFAGRRLRIAAYPWSLHAFRVTATGGFSFDSPPGTKRPAYAVAGETLRGRVHFVDDPVPLDFEFVADGVSTTQRTAREDQTAPPQEMTISTLEFNGSRPQTKPANDTEAGLDLTLHLMETSAPALEKNPLGAVIDDITVQAEIMGALPGSAHAAELKAWRDGGGTIEFKAVSLRWGPLEITGDGTMALDPDMQPEGAFSATLSGYDKAIDALIAANWVKPGPGSLAKLALGVASTEGRNGERSVKTPLTIQSRRISLGPMKLGEIPMLKLD